MKILISVTLILGLLGLSIAQSETVESINQEVNRIDQNDSLFEKEFDAVDVYKQAFDGGGSIKVFYSPKRLKKINEEIGLSYGRLTTTIYFNSDGPIKIIEKEENFKWNEELLEWDYSELVEVFKAEIYIFNWDLDYTKTFKDGKRRFSEGTCATLEYEPLIQTGKDLLKKE